MITFEKLMAEINATRAHHFNSKAILDTIVDADIKEAKEDNTESIRQQVERMRLLGCSTWEIMEYLI